MFVRRTPFDSNLGLILLINEHLNICHLFNQTLSYNVKKISLNLILGVVIYIYNI
jgi:hypothetical protein